MRLSISNFKQEAPVLGFVALAFLAIEFSLRVAGTGLSLDLQHIREIPMIVSQLRGADHPTLLFMGNSLTRRGVILEVLTKELASHGIAHAHIVKLHPDDTNIADWHYLYECDVRSMGIVPDLVLVGFAEEQLSDTQRLHLDLLGGYFGGFKALPEVFRFDARDLTSRIEYLLASLSCAYANHDRVRTQIFGLIIPYYKSSAQAMNRTAKEHPAGSGPIPPWHYQRLTRFLELTKDDATKVVFIAIPLPASYPIDPTLESVLTKYGGSLIDLRHTDGLSDADFLDGYHLTPHGGAVFSRGLVSHLWNSAEIRRSLRK